MKFPKYVAYNAEDLTFNFFDTIEKARAWLDSMVDQWGASDATIDGHSFIAEVKLVSGCTGKGDGSYDVVYKSVEAHPCQ